MKAVASVVHRVSFRNRTGGARAEESTPQRRTPRVARLLALAHQIDRRIHSGEWKNLADAARRLGFTRARITQIANLPLLAPEIQEAILDLPPVAGRDPITERDLRPIVAEPVWTRQMRLWSTIRPSRRLPTVG